MHGHQRNGHQQFILDQCQKIRPGLQRQNILVTLVVLGLSSRLVCDKPEPTVNFQRDRHRPEAALTSDRHVQPGLQMQPDRRLPRSAGTHFTSYRPTDYGIRLAVGMAFIGQPLESVQPFLTLHRGARFSKSTDIKTTEVPGLGSGSHHAGSVRDGMSEAADNRAMTTPPLPRSQDAPRSLILGSTSRYRRELLMRLRLPFDTDAPAVDETPLPGETPVALARRLALAKAREVAQRHPQAVVIGSDQVADLDGEPLGKPGTHERAIAQLRRMSGRTVVFQTAVAVVCAATGFEQLDLAPVRVVFRTLDDAEIERYLQTEQPYDCAGSAKSEGLGIALLARIDNDDPSALVGLPLIRTCHMLRAAGISIL